jgi:hypothetical protein
MARLLSPDDACVEAKVEGVRTGASMLYRRTPDGTMHVTDKNHIKALKDLGFTDASALRSSARTRTDYACRPCGFRSYFRTCSRCGADLKETNNDTTQEG